MSLIRNDADEFNSKLTASLPHYLGLKAITVEYGHTVLALDINQNLMATNGFLHAGSVVSLADSAAGFGCLRSLPEGAESFTTIELKTNLVGTATEGRVLAEAELVHAGKMTQVWEVKVRRELDDKVIARFSCTQMILYPR